MIKKDFLNFLNILYKLGKRRIFVESGLIFLNKLIKFRIINELFLFQSNKKLKKKGYNNINLKYLYKYKYKLSNAIKVNLGEDKLFKLKV